MTGENWYEVSDDLLLMQGEILLSCPTFSIVGELEWPLDEGSEVGVDAVEMNLIILSQSCDLENEKIADVLLGRVIPWPEARDAEVSSGNDAFKSSAFRRKLVSGEVPGHSLLHKHDGEPSMDWSIVDFHKLYTLPKEFLITQLPKIGSRLRLVPPYREHMAQAFARYFMRVGLPHNAQAFINEGKAN